MGFILIPLGSILLLAEPQIVAKDFANLNIGQRHTLIYGLGITITLFGAFWLMVWFYKQIYGNKELDQLKPGNSTQKL